MKTILLLGAGLVSKPLVDYLLSVPDFFVNIATRTVSKAEKLVGNHERGKAIALNVKNEKQLEDLVKDNDLTISLLPYTFHVTVAKLCIKYKKNMVTTSYVSDEMQALDKDAKNAGVLILNEIGVDPGIDHMSAMKIIHEVAAKGGYVESFRSYCGGLPAPDANTNPWGYKFSWSPRAVLMAGRNDGKYLEDGKEVYTEGKDLFLKYDNINIPGFGELEYYTNRDCLNYIDLYKIPKAKTMFRGTLRYKTWCETLKKVADLGLLDMTDRDDFKNITFKKFMTKFVPNSSEQSIKQDLAKHLNVPEDSHIIKKFEWLGLFSDEIVSDQKISSLDILANRMNAKMPYAKGEKDMLILHHDFMATYPDKKEHITSTMIDFGIPNGDSSMSRTVSLPAAIAAKLVLEEKIKLTGVHIPVMPEIYEPTLAELEKMGIVCKEKTERI